MPIYEYKCPSCKHQFEILQKMSDDPLMQCPNCHKDGLEKVISSTQFQLKGTGWYVTDFRDKDKKPKKEEASDRKNTSDTKKEE